MDFKRDRNNFKWAVIYKLTWRILSACGVRVVRRSDDDFELSVFGHAVVGTLPVAVAALKIHVKYTDPWGWETDDPRRLQVHSDLQQIFDGMLYARDLRLER